MSWPEEVPMLGATDMVRGKFSKGERHCLLGWKYLAIPSGLAQSAATNAIMSAIEEVAGRDRGHDIATVNDAAQSLSLLARIWNRAMYLLGYTEGNVESKRLPRMKNWAKGTK